MNTIAVIVTHNRLALLREAVEAVHRQSSPVQGIVVINNGSTDGTREWLDAQPGLFCIHQANLGGSHGFAEGIKQAYRQHADWIWVMDDDTIPGTDALRNLLSVAGNQTIKEEIGFLCSRVEWTDGTPHYMNIPHIGIFNRQGKPFNQYDNLGALHIGSCSFVSVLVSAKAVKQCGLPYREFFIWGDDMEYTERIIRAGLIGFYIPASVVLHKTASNYSANIFTDDDKSLWKYRYGIRNSLFVVRQQKGLVSYTGKLLKHLAVIPFKLLKKRSTHRSAFIRTVWVAAWNSIFFHPQKEMVDG